MFYAENWQKVAAWIEFLCCYFGFGFYVIIVCCIQLNWCQYWAEEEERSYAIGLGDNLTKFKWIMVKCIFFFLWGFEVF